MKTLLAAVALVAVALTVAPAPVAEVFPDPSETVAHLRDSAAGQAMAGAVRGLLDGPDVTAGTPPVTATGDDDGGPAPAAAADMPAAPPAPRTEPDAPACGGTGTAGRGDVDAAMAVITRDDGGTAYPAARWQQDRVGVAVTGDAVTGDAVAQVDRVLGWLSERTGVVFARGGDDIVVELRTGSAPRVVADVDGHRYVHAAVTYDPTAGAYSCRWAWEELLQATGVFGDHGPAGSVLSSDQGAVGPSDFDAWAVGSLYRADGLSDAAVRAALHASR